MKASILEIRRVEAVEKLAAEVAALNKRMTEIEAKLDKALSEKPVSVKANK